MIARRLACVLAIAVIFAASAAAHPGTGIVQDSRGNVFFTDLARVWKIAPDGRMTVAVPNVHTHELALDTRGNLYGEHLWFESATGKWFHRVWMMDRAGTVREVSPAREGFLTNYSFVRDRRGTMYWAEPGPPGSLTTIRQRDESGRTTTFATANFRSVQRMTVGADEALYVVDAGSLWRVSRDGIALPITVRLSSLASPPPASVEANYQLGLWPDAAGNVYVAVGAEHLVLRVTRGGRAKEVANRSATPWAPSGGMFDSAGNMWLLEYDTSNAVRVRRIDRNGAERVFTPGTK